MPTAHTLETVCNASLDIVGERPIASLLDDRAEVRWFARNYPHYVQTALRQNVWNFACELWSLNADITAPPYRWKYRYSLPNGWLRVLPPTFEGARSGTPIPHEVKGNFVLTDQAASLPVELVMDKQQPGEWDALFASMVSARLAYGMAHAFTRKASYVQLAKQMAQDAYDVAEQANAFEGNVAPIEQHDIIRVRSL